MNVLWYPLARQELAEVLMGKIRPVGAILGAPFLRVSDDVLLGISNLGRNDSTTVAAVALVGVAKKELFSWVSTYAEEIFPLTQFCRICAVEDWTELGLQTGRETTVGAVNPIWSSLVLGEMLGQADADADVAGAPLARASACFSFAMARTVLLYPEHEIAKTRCIERLAIVERDPRFGRRPITVESLKKVWSVALSLQNVPRESLNLLETVVRIVDAVDTQAAHLLRSNAFLQSDSAEDRIVGFDAIADAILSKKNFNAITREAGAVALAAASLLAGRGTSHIQLLAPSAKLFPETLVWYGLLAGALGPQSWDKAWMQQTKGVERALRQFFRTDEPVAADLCWPEYEWLSQTYDSLEVFSAIPRSIPKSLAIELLPGVSCQLRLVGQRQNVRVNDERDFAEKEAIDRSTAIRESAIEQAVDMLAQVQEILRPQRAIGLSQKSLFESDASARQDRQTRGKTRNKPGKTTR